MEDRDQRRLSDALRFALDQHGEQQRKGTTVPYASHLLQVAGLVLEHGGSVDHAIAGLLHDAIEDCGTNPDAIRERFGPEVAAIVSDCTDLLEGDAPDRKSPWHERKRRFVERIAQAPRASRLVVACDKLHNLRSLVGDLDALGVATFARFNAGPEDTLRHQRALRDALGRDLPSTLLAEIDGWLERLASAIDPSQPR